MRGLEKHEKYYLTGVDGKEQEVSEEIFRAYKHSVWNEEAQYKRERSVIRDTSDSKSELDKNEYIKVASIESIVAVGGEHQIGKVPDFPVECVIAIEENETLQLLGQALETLHGSEEEILNRHYCKNKRNEGNNAGGITGYPKQKVVKENGISVEHYYPNDHGNPAHLHVKGGGASTKIGPNGKPVKGQSQLSPKQAGIVKENLKVIKKVIKQIQKNLRKSS